jgi:Flp pilus assembly protein TadD
MQHVAAFSQRSRLGEMPAAPVGASKKTLWIQSSWRDLILYVGTPLLILPVFALAQARWSAQDIYLFVAAFGAMGHHLPGMIRAYGDRALFERFRWRFIFAPVFLLAVCVPFYWWDLKGIVLIVFFWGVWHGMMQTYGFCRIYDAKAGSFAALTRRLDFATCAIWFAAAVVLSPQRMADTLETYYASGGPFIPLSLLQGIQRLLLAAAIGVSILFLFNFSRMWAEGKRPNPVKLVLLLTSISFWWYCNNWVTNILAGIALFEVFHDVQYLSIVWIYNRSRVEKDRSIGGFMRFIFRRSGSLVGVYVGLVFAYGSLAFINSRFIEIDTVKRILTGVVAASGLLHFYYDGFIWKVRERSTREHLGLAGGGELSNQPAFLPSWVLHGLKWAAVFVIPLAALWLGQITSKLPEVESARLIAADLPDSARAHWKYGFALQKADRVDEAAEHYRVALRLDPSQKEIHSQAHFGLGQIFDNKNRLEEAKTELEEALRDEPRNGEIHSEYGHVLKGLGQRNEARAQFELATHLSPRSGIVHYDYAMLLSEDGKIDDAIREFQIALRHNPSHPEAHYHLGHAYYLKRDFEHARQQYEATARLDPKAPVHNGLGVVYMRLGLTGKAVEQFEEAVRQNPADSEAAENLDFARRAVPGRPY